MVNLITEISKYLIIFLMILFTLSCYTVFRHHSEKKKNRIFLRQIILMYLIHFISYVVLILSLGDKELVVFYGAQVIYLTAVLIIYRFCYPKASRLLVNNMCMLLTIGFVIQTRLSYKNSLKQFKILLVSTVISLLIPVFVRKMKVLKKLSWLYVIMGIGLLGIVALTAETEYGAKLSLSFGGLFSLQPTEFVKIIFVFFIASMLYNKTYFKRVALVTAIAGVHVLILAKSTDLGSALIFFVAYLVMVYVATKKPLYPLAGLAAGSGAAVIAYHLPMFRHVKERVLGWQDPFKYYSTQGYQVAQSLFAIGTGGWFGMGLCQGAPNIIPVADKDFVFSAISEELGGVFSICLILLCMNCFIMFVNISMELKSKFYKLIALGLGTIYGFQVFLTIGGGTKFIPMTGVTLPLVSYGGSSILATLLIFAIIQGLYILREDEEQINERRKQPRRNQKEEVTNTREKEFIPEAETEEELARIRAKEAAQILKSKKSE